MNRILPAVFLIVGSIIGAGFASGREISLFFAEFGYNSFYFLPIVFILFYYCFKIFLSLGSKEKFDNIFAINKLTNSSPFFNVALVAIFLISSGAMFAGGVEVLSNNFIDIPPFFFYAFIFIFSYIVLRYGFKGLVKINFLVIPIIVVLLVIYSLYSTLYPITNIPYIPSSESVYILPISIVVYVFANILLSYFIITEAGQGLSEKQIQKTSFLASLIICFVIMICIFCLVKNGAVVMDAVMPFIVLTLRLGDPFPILFTAVLFLGIITSLLSCLHTISSPFEKKFGKRTPLYTCTIVLLISILGFENIVNFCYPIIGVFGIFIVGKIIVAEYKKIKKST